MEEKDKQPQDLDFSGVYLRLSDHMFSLLFGKYMVTKVRSSGRRKPDCKEENVGTVVSPLGCAWVWQEVRDKS